MHRILRGFWHFESRQNSANLAPKLRFQPRCRQAARWSEVTFSGTAPTVGNSHTAVWSEAANGMYIFGGCCDSGSPVLGAAAGQRWRVPRPKDGRSCAEVTATTCISLTARPLERTEVGEASEQFLLGFPRLWDLNFLKTGDISKICRHQTCHLGSYFLCPFHFTTLLALRLQNRANMVLCSGGAAWVALQSRDSFRTHFGQGNW